MITSLTRDQKFKFCGNNLNWPQFQNTTKNSPSGKYMSRYANPYMVLTFILSIRSFQEQSMARANLNFLYIKLLELRVLFEGGPYNEEIR